MRLASLIPAVLVLLGALAVASDAGACCHKQKCPTPAICYAPVPCVAPAPVPVPAPAPAPAPVPVCQPAPRKHCCGHFRLFGHRRCCRKNVVYVAAPTCVAPVYAPVAPSYQAPGVYPAGQF